MQQAELNERTVYNKRTLNDKRLHNKLFFFLNDKRMCNKRNFVINRTVYIKHNFNEWTTHAKHYLTIEQSSKSLT